MNLEELKARLAELQAANEAILAKCQEEEREPTDEEAAELDRNIADQDRIQANIGRLERIGANARPAPRRAGPAAPVQPARAGDRQTGGFTSMGDFAAAVRAANVRHDQGALERLSVLAASVNEGAGSDGGFLVPPEFRRQIWEKVMGEESILGLTDQMETASNNIQVPQDVTTPWGSSGVRVFWEGEEATLTAQTHEFELLSARLSKLTALVKVTDEMSEDAAFVGSYLRSRVPKAMDSAIVRAIVQGNGAGKPLGYLKSPSLVTVPKETSQPADTIHHRNVVKMWSAMVPESRSRGVWIVHPDAEAQFQLMSFRDGSTTPVPVYVPPGGLAQTPYATLLGRPVRPVMTMPQLGDLGDITFVDLTQYMALLKTNGGVRTDISIHLYFDSGAQAYRFTFRMGGRPWWNSAISPENGSSTYSPFVTLATRD